MRHNQSRSHIIQQRASRVAAARKAIVYSPPDYDRADWPEPATPRFRWLWVVAIVAVGLVVTVAMFSRGFPWWHRAAHRECVANLRALEGSTALWAIQSGKTTIDTPTDADLFGPTRYLPLKPTCPAGGTYIIGTVGDTPRCTIPGHRIER